jgi:hypothetical protein
MKQNLSVAWSWTKKSLKTPALWTEFLECVHKKKGTLHVLCRYCHRSYAHPSKIGKDTARGNQNLNGPTTSMSRHLKECNLYKAKQPQSQSSMTSFLSTNESQIGQNDLLSKVLRFFISANIPFNVADNPYFQELIQTAQSKNDVQMVNRKNIRQQLRKMAVSAKEDLMTTLMQNDSKVSLALDCWTSKNNYAFLGM